MSNLYLYDTCNAKLQHLDLVVEADTLVALTETRTFNQRLISKLKTLQNKNIKVYILPQSVFGTNTVFDDNCHDFSSITHDQLIELFNSHDKVVSLLK